MAYKILGQSRPSATTNTTVYTAPGGTSAVVSSIVICNTSGTADTFRLFVVPSGQSASTSYAVAYDASISGNDTITMTIGVTLGAGEFIVVYSTNATTTFSVFGNEA